MDDSSEDTVLVVDNREQLVDVYAAYLEDAGYTVRMAYNGREGLEVFDADVDVVLLDRRMPEMSGDEMLAEIRTRPDWCRVVMVTSQDPDLEVAELAFDEYLTKPVDEAELLSTMEQMLMLEEYHELLDQYLSLTKRYAIIESHNHQVEIEDSDAFRELARQRDAVRQDLAALIADFADPDFTEAYQEIHSFDFGED
jgi:CheY-like chemotaxis protein